MKHKVLITGLIVMCGLLFAACGSAEKSETPTITEKPKVNIVDPATPTPTLTLEQGELPEETATPVPTETAAPKPTAAATPTPKPTATPKPTKKPTATPAPTPAEDMPYEKGTLTQNGFESKWMGLKFNAPDGVELSSQEELDETMRLMEEALHGEASKGELDYEELPIVYEMELVWQDEGLILQLLVEKLTQETVTEADYVDVMKEELSLLEESGFTYIMDDKLYSEVIGGKKFTNFGYTTYAADEVGLHQENYLRQQGDRIILISIMCEAGTEDRIPKLLDAFTAY